MSTMATCDDDDNGNADGHDDDDNENDKDGNWTPGCNTWMVVDPADVDNNHGTKLIEMLLIVMMTICMNTMRPQL